jgi:hypothetical protein
VHPDDQGAGSRGRVFHWSILSRRGTEAHLSVALFNWLCTQGKVRKSSKRSSTVPQRMMVLWTVLSSTFFPVVRKRNSAMAAIFAISDVRCPSHEVAQSSRGVSEAVHKGVRIKVIPFGGVLRTQRWRAMRWRRSAFQVLMVSLVVGRGSDGTWSLTSSTSNLSFSID